MTPQAYSRDYPEASLASERILSHIQKDSGDVREPPPPPQNLTVNFAGIEHPVNPNVPANVCLSEPWHYRIPKFGPLAEDIYLASLALQKRRSVYIYGSQGTGKDGFVHAWSARTRTPSPEPFQMIPNVDLQPWLWTRSMSKEGTYWEEGLLLKYARDGYPTIQGPVPALILLTDFDRATKSQAEFMRMLLDTIEGRIPRPDGGAWPVFPGTVFAATANTAGMGDETGRYTSTSIIDATILSRFQRKVKFHLMDWRDEEPILRVKFPLFAQKMDAELKGSRDSQGAWVRGLGAATQVLREKIEAGDIFADFSHRELCNWVGAAADLLSLHPRRNPRKGLMKMAGRMVFDGFPDEQTRLKALRLLNPLIKDGMLDEGDTDGVEDSDLDTSI